MDAPYGKEFVFADGSRAKNLNELNTFLKSATRQQFEAFVRASNNDFANWIEYVLMDAELANTLRKTTDFDLTKKVINDACTPKRSLFSVFKQDHNHTVVVEHRKPIEKLPEPRHTPELPLHDDVKQITNQRRFGLAKWLELARKPKHESRLHENPPQKEHEHNNIGWVIAYSVLIVLIVGLVVYQVIRYS